MNLQLSSINPVNGIAVVALDASGVRTRHASPIADAGGMVLRVLSACVLGARPLTLLRERDASYFVDCVFRQVQSECQRTPWAEPSEDLSPSDVAARRCILSICVGRSPEFQLSVLPARASPFQRHPRFVSHLHLPVGTALCRHVGALPA